MTIADELEARMLYLADPAVWWVQHWPALGQSCLVRDAPLPAFHPRAAEWLNRFFDATSGGGAADFNDRIARDRNDVLWMLQEAVDQARWEDV